MDSEVQPRSGINRNGSRRSQRGDRRNNPQQGVKNSPQEGYSSTDEDAEARTNPRGGFRIPTKGERNCSGRSRVTPSDIVPQGDLDLGHREKIRPSGDLNHPSNGEAIMSQIPPHYYQEVSQGHYGNNLDEYESPMMKGGRRPPGGRRLVPPQGSSLSSSDNNSDTTYAESDINNSLRARMTVLDNDIAGTPPEPAPPEVPPRGPSHHHPLLSAQRRCGTNSSGSPHYQDPPSEDGYQQPGQNVFLSQGFCPAYYMKNGRYPERFISAEECGKFEYLMSGTNPRYGGKSPAALYGPSPNREYITPDFTQSRIIGTMDQKSALGGGGIQAGGVGLTTLPVVMNNLSLTSRPSFSGRGLHLGKSWKEKCSWRCTAIGLIILAALLASLLAYFAAAYATLDNCTKGCIVVEDAAKVIAASAESEASTTNHPTPVYKEAFPTKIPYTRSKPLARADSIKSLNTAYSSKIPPQEYWQSQFEVKQPMFLRFNFTIPRSSQLAIYGRRNAAPSITRYEFVQFVRGGRASRTKREATVVFVNTDGSISRRIEKENVPISNSLSSTNTDISGYSEDGEDHENLNTYFDSNGKLVLPWDKNYKNKKGRSKRYLGEREVNISMVHQIDTGTLYLSIYNDGLVHSLVSVSAEEISEIDSACPMGCASHGSCVLGKCKCMQGWIGDDCSQNVCPLLCSGHGTYAGGICHCHMDWKGRECDVPIHDCEAPDCSGHGICISGICRCHAGWQGENCNIVDCKDPACGGHGWCVGGSCVCRAGWTSSNCTQIDHKVFTCLPDCSGNGHYDLHTSTCICDPYWSGRDCSEARCTLDCVHGACNGNVCTCREGWAGLRCNERTCDDRCQHHGQCHNGTCLCVQGWNGKHCTIPGCVNSCSGHGLCTTDEGLYHCSCSVGWTGVDCSVPLETQCTDERDNDGDGLADCNDSECCSTEACKNHVMCMVSSDPVEVLLRKQPPSVTASFYQRVKFIIEDKTVQSFARKDEFSDRRVSIIRGRVVTPKGQGIVGVRTSVDKESKYGLTATRKGGWFDLLLNGGGAVTLQFQRAHFEPLTVSVPLFWNEIVVLEPVVMRQKDQPSEPDRKPIELKWSSPCADHDNDLMKPQVVSTYIPHSVGSVTDSSVIFTESQIVQESLRIPGSSLNLVYHSSSVAGYMSTLLIQLTPDKIPSSLSMVHLKITLEGIVFEKLFEADPNITYTFSWNKRNVYKQKVYGETTAKVGIGFKYVSCEGIVWEIQTAKLHGFHMDISGIGGWNLGIHHMYNFERGLLQKGDGSTLDFKEAPRLVKTLMGNGSQRPSICRHCSGLATDAELLTPVALATGPDGSIYVGDFDLIRKITRDGFVFTVLQLGSTRVSKGYHITVSPADGKVYMSDQEKYQVFRLLTVSNVSDPVNNLEVVAGNGERCIPGDEKHCGDKGLARNARLSHPKGIAISTDHTMYLADGSNIRMVDSKGIIQTLIGHHGHKSRWKPLPCTGGIPANQVELQWPTSLALSTLDNSLHILDDHAVLQVTLDGTVRVKAGTPLHCKSSERQLSIGTITDMSFSPGGSLFLAEETSSKHFSILEISPSGKLTHFAGASPKDCGCVAGEKCICREKKVAMSTGVLLGSVSAITVSYDGIVHVADQQKLKILSFAHFIPTDDHNGDYLVSYPKKNELYVFNRHGHHVETRDLVTGRTIYAFLYSKNTSFGRLSKVTDSSGNKIVFLRDYDSAVSQVENTVGEKFKIEISRLGLMTRFAERSGRHFDFTYDDESGLLLESTTPGRLTTVYEYDFSGRVQTVVLPTGHRMNFNSHLDGSGIKKYMSVGMSVSVFNSRQDQEEHTLSLINEHRTLFSHNGVQGEVDRWPNGTWMQEFPWGGSISAVQATTNPLVEVTLPTQARLLTVPQQFEMTASTDSYPNTLVTSFGVVEDHILQERLVEKLILVNGSRVLNRRWKGAEQAEYLMDGETLPLLQVSYNSNGQPTNLIIGNRLTMMNTSYDRFGRLGSRYWEKSGEEYEYNQQGQLSMITTSSSAVTRYEFSDSRLLKSISLPSGRSWFYQYDTRGGLKMIVNPSGSSHTFSLQPSFGGFVFSYTAPGSPHSYRQHFDHSARLILTSYPSGSSKMVYKYSDSGQMLEVASGDGKTTFLYGDDSLVSEILHEEREIEYKWDNLYHGKLISEHRIEYSAKTGLSNLKLSYDYDSHYRLVKLTGRVGGQTLHSQDFSYHRTTGSPSKIGKFQILKNSRNETIIQDGTAIFSRIRDTQLRVVRLSLTIHKMKVFSLDISYQKSGKISQTNTYTRNFHSKPFSNMRNFTYDADGQLISVEAKKPWYFSYDANGNMLSLSFSTNKIPMQYDAQDRLIKLGKQGYKYDSKGAFVQNVREVNYQYNARGLLTRATKSGRFSIRYFYDHEDRLIARKDNFGNVTQFLYADHRFSKQVTHIYNPRDGNLVTLLYDDNGHVIFAQVHRNKYYIATDECGSPIMMFNQYGEVVREIMRSPYGHNVYDTNPYLYLPIDYCGGLRESITELVHMPNGKVYDPLIGLWLHPDWESIPDNFMKPSRLSLYRFNGNDPINVGIRRWQNYGYSDWLKKLGYELDSIAPQLPTPNSQSRTSMLNRALWSAFTKEPSSQPAVPSAFANQIISTQCVSGFIESHRESLEFVSKLATFTPSLLRRDFWPDSYKFEISITPGPFGEGILVSTVDGTAIVTATQQANPIFRDVLTSVFNSTVLLDVVLSSHNSYVFYFVKENFFKATEDMTQLNRLAGEVNISVHEPGMTTPFSNDDERGDKVVDIKLHSAAAVVHIRYGTTPKVERKRLLKHAKKVVIRRAWSEERDRVSAGLPGSISWTPSEREELLSRSSVSSYSARYLHSPEDYPDLLDDPTNIKFYKDTKRTRRNLKSRKSRRCRRRWWKPFC